MHSRLTGWSVIREYRCLECGPLSKSVIEGLCCPESARRSTALKCQERERALEYSQVSVPPGDPPSPSPTTGYYPNWVGIDLVSEPEEFIYF
jgi:hypothetical protein